MARTIALEWDAREARIVVASSRGNDVLVEQAFAVELASSSAGAPSAEEVAQQLTVVLGERGLQGCDALVALPRSQIELRTLTLPQAPPEEIPDMVRFQAMQAFTSIAEDWPLDYIELQSDEPSINVVATVVSPKLVEQTQAVCAASELKMRCLVLRPFAAISLLHRYESIDVFRSSLVVEMLPEAADLTAINNGQVIFMRSVRLPPHADVAARASALVGELKRTIGAAQNQMGGSRVEQIIICGSVEQTAVLRASVASALSLEVLTFQPFEAVRLARELAAQLPDNSGRFASLLGMLACHVTGTGHTIDFLNPRKRPTPPSRRRRYTVIAAAVLTLTAVGATWFYSKKSALDEEIAALQVQSDSLDQAVARARELMALVDRVRQFEYGDITWLDEIRQVAQRMPGSDEVILREIYLGVDPEMGGRMTLKGNVATSDVIAKLEKSLRFGDNRVKGYYGAVDPTRRDYPYQIEATVTVPPDVLEEGHSLGRPKLPAAQHDAPTHTPNQLAERAEDEKPDAVPAPDDANADREPPAGEATANPAGEQPDTSAEPRATDAATGGERRPIGEYDIMNPRERLLAIVVGALLGVLCLYYGGKRIAGVLLTRADQVRDLQEELNTKDLQQRRGRQARRVLDRYLERTLPGDEVLANSRYRAWLHRWVKSAQISRADVKWVSKQTITLDKERAYDIHNFSVNCQTSLPQLVDLLYHFYHEDYLHRIKLLHARPLKGKELSLKFSLEAISLPGVRDQGEELAPLPSQRLAFQSVDYYHAVIVQRNPYSPANQPPKFASSTNQRGYVNQRMSFSPEVTDPESGQMQYRVEHDGLDGLTIDEDSGRIEWTPNETGEYEIFVYAKDNGWPAKEASQVIRLQVNEPPPPSEAPPPRRTFDEAKYTFLTGIVEVNGRRQVWLSVRTEGKWLRLHEGDTFEVGAMQGRVVRIFPRSANIETDRTVISVRFGQSLHDGTVVPQSDDEVAAAER